MPAIENKEINKLRFMEHSLVRKYDRGELEEAEYMNAIKEIRNRILIMTHQLVKTDEVEKNTEEIIMEEETKVEEKKVPKEKKVSYAKLILKALEIKTTKSIEDVVVKVVEWNPDGGREPKSIARQVKSTIHLLKQQKEARWQKYTWDEASFLLTEKTAE